MKDEEQPCRFFLLLFFLAGGCLAIDAYSPLTAASAAAELQWTVDGLPNSLRTGRSQLSRGVKVRTL